MITAKTNRPTVEEILQDLEAQRNDPELQRQYRRDLEATVKAYEETYGMTGSEAHAAIERRELRETLEVCDWLMDDAALKRAKARDAER